MKIFLFILLFLLFLLCVPVIVEVTYREELTVTLRYFFRLTLYPAAKKEKPAPEKKPAETKTEKPQTAPKQKPLDRFLSLLEMLRMLLSSLKKPFLFLLHTIWFSKVWLHIVVSREDAHQTALRFGQTHALVYSVLAFLNNGLQIKKPDIQIQADFFREKEELAGGGRLCIIPLTALIAGVWFACSFGWQFLRKKVFPPKEETAPVSEEHVQ